MSQRRRRFTLSIAARTALVAGLVGGVLAIGFTVWLRHTVYSDRYEATSERAAADLSAMLTDGERRRDFPGAGGEQWRDLSDATYQTVSSDGKVLVTAETLMPFAGDAALTAFPPKATTWGPYRVKVRLGAYEAKGVCTPEPSKATNSYCDQARTLAGQQVEAWQMIQPANFYQPTLSGETTVSFAMFILPFDAQQAVAGVDRVLRPAMPLAVLLIMLGAYAATRLSLRPVDRMRAEASRISAQALHRRLPVPPSNDAIERLALALNETLDRLERSADQQRRFVADAAHELRNPIAGLRAVLEVAEQHPDTVDLRKVIVNAVGDTRGLQNLANDLLLVAGLDAEPNSPGELVDLAELVRRQVARRWPERVELTVDAIPAAPVLGNPGQLERLVRNLLDNAVRHALTTVAISVESGSSVVLRIADDGPGIPVEDRERVFERFTRLDESRVRDSGGAGLGLAIAREIAGRHDATLTVTDAPSGGACLNAEFPLPQSQQSIVGKL
jgi:signal transduction histidine kinase